LIDPVAALDLAVLLRSPRSDVPVTDARLLQRQRKVEGKLGTVVRLDLADREREAPPDVGPKGERAPESQMSKEAEYPEAGAVVQRGVLICSLPANFDMLHIDLDRIAGLRLFEEPQLARAGWPLAPAGQGAAAPAGERPG
jgi:hypothetical protein